VKENHGLIPTIGKEGIEYKKDPEILCGIFNKIIETLAKEAKEQDKNTTIISCNGTRVTIDFKDNSIEIKAGNQLTNKNFSATTIEGDPELCKIFTDFFFPQTTVEFTAN
jgi:hypothetical protein